MGNRLFVGNLPFDATESQVRSLIASETRKVTSVKLVTDKETGKPRGFAFVDVEDDAQAQSAISELNGKDFSGRALVVNEAQERAGGKGGEGGKPGGGGGGFRGTPHGKEGARSGFGMRGPSQGPPRGSSRGGGRGGGRGS